MGRRSALGVLLAFGIAGSGMAGSGVAGADSDVQALYGEVLRRFVDDRGLVDYAGLKRDREALDRYLKALGEVDPAAYESWAREAKIAFWINAYNAFTLRSVVEAYPIEKRGLFSGGGSGGIRDIPGVWTRSRHRVMGKEVSLDHIEHEILRKEFDEPRIHMALNCASLGCPELRREPYEGGRLDAQLKDQTVRFLSSDRNFQVDHEERVVRVSRIFDWFGDDFKRKYGTDRLFRGRSDKDRAVLYFIALHLEAPPEKFAASIEGYGLKHLDYDWRLNDRDPARR